MASKPKKKKVSSSSLRPDCPADQRLFEWVGTSKGPRGRMVKESLRPMLEKRILSSWGEGTKKTYGTGLRKFHIFCDQHAVSEEDRMPISEELLLCFVSWMGGYSAEERASGEEFGLADDVEEVGEASMGSYVAAVRAWHLINGFPWNFDKIEGMVEFKRVIRRAQTISHKKNPRNPVTLKMLVALRKDINWRSHLDVAVWAQALTMFWGLLRLGEATVKSLEGFDPIRHSSRSSFQRHEPEDGPPFFVFEILGAKTAKPGKSQCTYITRQIDPLDPVSAIEFHLRLNKLPSELPAFAYISGDGYRPMTRDAFLRRVNTAWKAAGWEGLSGHCFRIGGAAQLLAWNTPFDVVRKQGRWKSDSFLLYVRHWELIMPNYLRDNGLKEKFGKGRFEGRGQSGSGGEYEKKKGSGGGKKRKKEEAIPS